MSITKALRSLSKEDAAEVKEIMADLQEQDGMDKQAAAETALHMVLEDADNERNDLIKRMTRGA